MEAVTDDATFSSSVSVHVAVPNGMDAPEHTAFRAVVDRSFTLTSCRRSRRRCRRSPQTNSALLFAQTEIEVMSAIAEPSQPGRSVPTSAGHGQWHQALQDWAHESATATRARDRAQLNKVAEQFDRIIVEMLDQQAAAGPHGPAHDRGATTRGTDRWQSPVRLTTGEHRAQLDRRRIGNGAAAVGIIIEFLARRPDMLEMLHTRPEVRQAAMDGCCASRRH